MRNMNNSMWSGFIEGDKVLVRGNPATFTMPIDGEVGTVVGGPTSHGRYSVLVGDLDWYVDPYDMTLM